MPKKVIKSPTLVSFTIKRVPEIKRQNFNVTKKVLHAGLIAAVLFSSFGLTLQTTEAATSANISPSAVGNYDGWTANTGTKVNAVATNDAGTTFISATANNASETFVMPGAAIPAASTINSVTLNVMAA